MRVCIVLLLRASKTTCRGEGGSRNNPKIYTSCPEAILRREEGEITQNIPSCPEAHTSENKKTRHKPKDYNVPRKYTFVK